MIASRQRRHRGCCRTDARNTRDTSLYIDKDIEYDLEKNAVNLAKHGLSLTFGAAAIENCIGAVDGRRDHGEIRINAFGLVSNRLFVCTYTMRGETHRLIPVRKASRQEQKTWLR